MQKVVVVSNRLPIVLKEGPDGSWTVGASSGGLVQALRPILERGGGTWIGWPGLAGREDELRCPLSRLNAGSPYNLVPVELPVEDIEGYYSGFANSVLWPLFHGMPNYCEFRPAFWESYLRANQRFADTVMAELTGDELVWVHDYHLIHLGANLRARGHADTVGFFLHIPFPELRNFMRLPWRADLLRALLAYDLVGFQAVRDQRSFLECVERLMPEVTVHHDRAMATVHANGHVVRVGVFPIGMDFDGFAARAESREVDERVETLRRDLAQRQVILGIDRLDYTKGLVERLLAFEVALERYPSLRERVMLLQLLVPSRESVPEYRAIKEEIERLIGRISGRFATTRWTPIRYLYNTVDQTELVALYRLATAALITPLCDGMNLVAKEFCASRVDDQGVLILSENAGAAAQLASGAIVVNPYNLEETAAAIHRAVNMNRSEARKRMRELRAQIKATDVFWWADTFLHTLRTPKFKGDFEPRDYLPTIELDSPASMEFVSSTEGAQITLQ
jgi:trehalose 6-phosphate synthase